MRYQIGEAVFQRAAHHDSIKALWDTKWSKRAATGIHPFNDANLEDFKEVFAQLIEMDLQPPYDFERYAGPFFPVAERLEEQATAAEADGHLSTASKLYLRAAALYRIARFPTPQSPKQKVAWERNKAAYLKGAQYMNPPIVEKVIPHKHGLPGTSEENSVIPVYIRLPSDSNKTYFPTIINIFGLDGYRTEFTPGSTGAVSRGWACIAVEVPGTADCPALQDDPESPDRLFSSILDWVEQQEWVEKGKVVAWGRSTGGYYAVRVAHTHPHRLAGVVAQGAGTHHMFDPEWLDVTSHLDYAFDLAHSLALKFGYKDVESMKKDSRRRFSLLENGILDRPSTRLLLVNGTADEIFPIEDSLLTLQHGSVKEARFLPGLRHMGDPAATKLILEWIPKLLQTIPSASASTGNEHAVNGHAVNGEVAVNRDNPLKAQLSFPVEVK
ncbi:MAG: hypothetical protein M1816_003469 [Peltula sp. TS41687]|nr:MAG: hypothetical protein M1816_003469 [Peltula sp. TS41687]